MLVIFAFGTIDNRVSCTVQTNLLNLIALIYLLPFVIVQSLEHLLGFIASPRANPQKVTKLLLGEKLQILLTDQPAIGDHHYVSQPEASLQVGQNFFQSLFLCRVTWKNMVGNRKTIGHYYTQNNLNLTWLLILRLSVTTQLAFRLFTAKISAGQVIKDHIHLNAEQVSHLMI